MSGDQDKVVQAVQVWLETRGTLTGTKAAEIVRAAVPGFAPSTYGFKSMREFILASVPGCTVVARAGMDVIYGFGGAEGPTHDPSVDMWRVWASPNSSRALAVKIGDGQVRAVLRGAQAQNGEAVLATPAATFHLEMARKFLDSCGEPVRTQLALALEAPADRWWETWTAHLAGRSESQQWFDWRRQGLVSELRAELQRAGVADDLASAAVTNVVRSHEGRERPERLARTEGGANITRDVVLKAVRDLPEAELRLMRLPVGAVLDALRELGVLR